MIFCEIASQNEVNANAFRKDVSDHDIKVTIVKNVGFTVNVIELQ